MVFKLSGTSQMEFFTNIVDGLHPLTTFAKRSIWYSILEVLNSTLIMQDVFKTFSRRLQDLFKTCLQDIWQLCPQDVFKTSSRRHGRQKNITLKTSSRILQYVFTKTNVCWDVVVRSFLRTLRTSAGKRLSWKPFLRKFNLFKIDSGKGFFLPVFKIPFYCCFQTLNRSAFLWMITLFFLLNAPKYLGARLFHSLFVKTLHIFWNLFLSKKIC